MKEKDKRIKLMSEVLNGIKVLKLYAWEQSYSDIISGIRQKELVMLRRMGFLNAATTLIFQIAPFFVSSNIPVCKNTFNSYDVYAALLTSLRNV